MYLIMADTYMRAAYIADTYKLKRNEWSYLRNEERLRGVNDATIVICGESNSVKFNQLKFYVCGVSAYRSFDVRFFTEEKKNII